MEITKGCTLGRKSGSSAGGMQIGALAGFARNCSRRVSPAFRPTGDTSTKPHTSSEVSDKPHKLPQLQMITLF
jgi:hypothetical protein